MLLYVVVVKAPFRGNRIMYLGVVPPAKKFGQLIVKLTARPWLFACRQLAANIAEREPTVDEFTPVKVIFLVQYSVPSVELKAAI